MTETEAKEQLSRVFVAYPSFRTELERQSTGNQTLRAWCMMLVHCDPDDVASVVDEIVSGDREPYGRFEKPEVMPRLIRTEANDRRSKRGARDRQQVKYHDACTEARAKDPKLGRYWKDALHLGGLVRDRKISVDENKEMMAALRAWYLKSEPYPEWIHDVLSERESNKQGSLV